MPIEPVVQVVEALVEATEPVVQAVHPSGDALHAPAHAVEAAVQLGERLSQPVRQGLHRAEQCRERGILRVELRDGLVEPLGQHADLGAVR